MTTAVEKMTVPFVDLKAQYRAIGDETNAAMEAVLNATNFIMGQQVADFEAAFAEYCGVAHGIGVDSGTSGLELAVRALGLGLGDEVITAANTFAATVISIMAAGANPVLVDMDEETYNIDVNAIEAAITPNTKAIMPVHLYGQPADMDPIMELAERHNLYVIEDASQSHGALYKGKRVGSIGHISVFSLYPAKNLGAYGDAGIVVTDDAQLADNVAMFRNYGQRKKYHHDVLGFNRRMDTLQAAVLNAKLPHLDGWNAARREHAAQYSELLADVSWVTRPFVADFAEPVWHLYVIRVPERERLQAYLQEHGISTGIHYPIPIHESPAFASLGYGRDSFPKTEAYAENIVSLPMYPEMTSEMVEYVVARIADFS